MHLEQRGNIAFYALVILPFVMTLTVLAVDISGWNSLRDQTQRQADALAFQAAQLLPDRDRALSFVAEKMASESSSPSPSSAITLADYNFTNHSVKVSLAASYPAVFDMFLEFVGAEQVFQINETGVVQVVPNDYMIILSDAATLRPALNQAPWGDAWEWPPSGYWSCSTDHAMGMAMNTWSELDRKRWATQSCYNPVFSNIKLAAINLVDVLGASQTNRLGVMFTPGDTTGLGYRLVRHVQGQTEIDGNTYFTGQIGGFVDAALAGPEATWRNYQEFDTNLGDEACILFADPNWDSTYALPGLSQTPYFGLQHIQSENCLQPIHLPYCGSNSHGPYGVVDSCYLANNLRLREAIYWHAAIPSTSEFLSAPQVLQAIQASITELHGFSGLGEGLSTEQAVRGNIALQTPKKIIFISDWFVGATNETLDNTLQLLVNTQTQLILVHVDQTYGLNNSLRQQTAEWLTIVANRVQELIPDNNQQNIVRILRSSSPEQLVQEVVPKLILLGRQEALKQ